MTNVQKLSPFLKSAIVWFAATILGFITTIQIVGSNVINPSNTNWIYHGINADPIQHYYGWLFFKDSKWLFPLGLNPGYGATQASSIVYSDSIPFMALISKMFSPWINSNFQYFGIWLLLCFIFQSYFTIRILKLFCNDISIIFLVVALVNLTPILIWRMQAHMALSGHFLILFGIYLMLISVKEKKYSCISWNVLLCASVLVHAYLFAMVCVLWCASIVNGFFKGHLKFGYMIKNIISSISVVGLVMVFVAGYDFNNSNSMSGTSVEYGTYRWNLLSPFSSFGYSNVLTFLPSTRGNFDTYSYLGAGFCVIGVAALIRFRQGLMRITTYVMANKTLVAIVLLLVPFSISNKVAVGNLRFTFEIPRLMIEVFSVFSSSARFIWPVIYLGIFSLVYLIITSYDKRKTIAIISLALIVQIVDTVPLIQELRNFTTSDANVSNNMLQNETLKQIAARDQYQKILVIPSGNRENFGFPEVTFFAHQLGLSTNSVYLARVNHSEVMDSRRAILSQLETGNLKRDTIYVLQKFEEKLIKENLSTSDVFRLEDKVFVFPR